MCTYGTMSGTGSETRKSSTGRKKWKWDEGGEGNSARAMGGESGGRLEVCQGAERRVNKSKLCLKMT